MAARSYPERNPFPVQATASIEATGQGGPTVATSVQTPQLQRAWMQVEEYLHSPMHPSSEGAALALHGGAGTGKTHTLRYLAERAVMESAREQRPCVVAYVLSSAADPPAMRYAILKEIPLTTLQAVSRRFISVIGREHVDRDADPETDPGREERARLRENLPQIGELIRSALIDPEEVNRRQTEELREAGNEDIRNALSYIDDPELGQAARAWLCGELVDAETLLRLGARTKERIVDHSHRALRVLIRLFQRTETSLLVFLDQCETFIKPDRNAPVVAESVPFVQGLVQLLPKEKAFLAVAMSEDAWKALPDYLRQRFGLNAFHFSAITVQTAHEFIHTYTRQEPLAQGAAPDIFPFEADGVKEVLASVRGNLRGFLQTCHEAFKLAAPGALPITSDIVRQALTLARQHRPTLEQVVRDVDAFLRERALELGPNSTLPAGEGGGRRSYLVVKRGGTPVAWLEVSASLFIDDEASHSVTTLDAVKRAREDPRRLPVVVIVVGYVSPEIQTRLAEATPHVIVYESDTLPARLTEVLVRVQATSPGPPSGSITTADLDRLRDELLNVLQSRKQEAVQTTIGAGAVLQKAEQTRIDEIWREARVNWVKERRQIEEQIKAARKGRQEEELAALESERRRAASERVQRIVLLWGAILLALLVGAWGSSQRMGPDEFYIPFVGTFAGWIQIVSSAFGLATAGAVAQFYGFPGPVRALWGKVRSLDELNDIASMLARQRRPQRHHLASQNPQLRYAAVRSLDWSGPTSRGSGRRLLDMLRPPGWIRIEDMTAAAHAERNTTVRRAIAWHVALRRSAGTAVDEVGSKVTWPERVYMEDDHGLDGVTRARLSGESLELVERLRSDPELREAFERGITQEAWPALVRRSSLPRVQSLLRELSPLERPGLGTFDYLHVIPEIDGLYLFFRQWLYYIELDVPLLRP